MISNRTAVCTLLLVMLPLLGQERRANPTAQSFAGTWTATCADGAEFVALRLSPGKTGLDGTVSMGNFKGDNGQCKTVVSPPSPEHAMKVVDAKLQGEVLSFKGDRGPSFEMTLAGAHGAELKFMGTPVESQPWVLKRQN